MHEELGRLQPRRDLEHTGPLLDARVGCQAKHLDIEHAHAGVGKPALHLRQIERMLVRLPRHRNQAQANVAIARLRGDADLLVMRQLENGERRESDGALHSLPRDLKMRIIRSASGSMPVKWRNAPTAWYTAMPLPSSVRQPFARATRRSSVSSGK